MKRAQASGETASAPGIALMLLSWTGYTPSPTALHVISQFIASVRKAHARVPTYLLDPVLGDTDRGYYVDTACLPLYRELMPLADIITPNSWEAE